MFNRITPTTLLLALLALLAIIPTTASAEEVGGAAPPGDGLRCGNQFELFDTDEVSAAGTLTEFRFRSGSQGARADLHLLRPTGETNKFKIVGLVTVTDPGDGSLVRVPASIPAEAGDVIGLYTVDPDFPCVHFGDGTRTSGFTPLAERPEVGDELTAASTGYEWPTNLEATIGPASGKRCAAQSKAYQDAVRDREEAYAEYQVTRQQVKNASAALYSGERTDDERTALIQANADNKAARDEFVARKQDAATARQAWDACRNSVSTRRRN